MASGLKNPLGALALYVFQDGVDKLYLNNGTNESYIYGKSDASVGIRLSTSSILVLFI